MKRTTEHQGNFSKQSRLTSFFGSSAKAKNEKELPVVQSRKETSQSDVPQTSQSQPMGRKFKLEWCTELKWLIFDSKSGIAKCEVCSSLPNISDGKSKIVQGYTGPFKLESFKKHDLSLQHKKCILTRDAQICPQSTPMATCIKKMDEKMFNHLKVLFDVSYYIAKNNKPFSDFEGLLQLNSKLGVEMLDQYNNDKRCKEFVSSIGHTIRKKVVSEIQESDYVSLLLDGSTDNADVEEMILFARYIKESTVCETLLSIVPLESASTEGYYNAIEKELQKLGLHLLNSPKLVGIGTDGAASMIGAQNGLVQRIGKTLSHVIGIHCIAHRLNLSVLSSVKNAKFMEDIDMILKSLYKFYQQSPKRMRELKKVSEGLECKLQKFQYLHNVRWVASKVGALTALLTDWKCVTLHLESIAAGKETMSPTAKGLLKKLTDFKFVRMIHFLLDFLNLFKAISLLFQKEELFLSTIELHVKNTITSLSSLKSGYGPNEEKLVNNTSLSGMYQSVQLQGMNASAVSYVEKERENLIESGVRYLQERFLNVSKVEKCTSVFDTFMWPNGSSLENFGVSEIQEIGRHFKSQLSQPDDDMIENVLLNEWYEFKVLGAGRKLRELLKLSQTNSERFPILNKLLSIVCVLPTSTVSCERGFSLMNLIKNKFRSSMESDSLNDLMMINLNGPSSNDFDPSESVDHWFFSAKTVRHVHGHKKH